MTRYLAATAAALAASAALAQYPTGTSMPATPADPFKSAGTGLGVGVTSPVGTAFPRTLPTVGTKVGTAPGTNQMPSAINGGVYGTGQSFDPSGVVAPYPKDGSPEPNVFDRALKRWAEVLGLDNPPQRAPSWVPGLGRRNRERAQQARAFRRD